MVDGEIEIMIRDAVGRGTACLEGDEESAKHHDEDGTDLRHTLLLSEDDEDEESSPNELGLIHQVER